MLFFKRAALLISGIVAGMMSSNTSQALEESWMTFFREDPHGGWIITLDQTTTSGQRGELGHCARLTYTFGPSQLAENGFPKTEPSQRYYELEDRICAKLSNISCRSIASKVGQGKRYVWFCANNGSLVDGAAKVTESFKEFQTTVETAPFAELRGLHPTNMEAQIAQNELLLKSLEEEGDIFQRPRKVMHWIYGATAATKKDISTQLKKLGYTIEETEGDKIVFSRIGRIDRHEFNDETRKLNILCADFGCMYDGWETAVVRK